MKKKKILLTFALAAMMGLAGCGETPVPGPSNPDDPPVVVVDPVVTGITISSEDNKTSLAVGETLKITAKVTGEGAFNSQYTLSVDKEDVASISTEGVLTAKAKGVVRVTATATGDSSKKASLDITVVQAAVTGITLTAADDKTSVEVGETLQLTAKVTGEGKFDDKYTLSVDKEDVATVSAEGLLTAKARGVVRVTATATGDTTKTASLDITVTQSGVTGITLAAAGGATSVEISKTLQLTATVTGEGNFNNNYTLSVDKTDVASISSEGVLTGKAAGVVRVTATATGDTTKTASLDITVAAASVSEIKDVVGNKYVHVVGKVSTIGQGCYFVDDGTGVMEVYCNGYNGTVPEDITLGKVVELTGVTEERYGVIQLSAVADADEYFTVKASEQTISSTSLDASSRLDAAGYDAIAQTATKLTPIKFRGTALKNQEFQVDDTSSNKLHVSYPSDAIKNSITVGKEYDVAGYMAPYHTTNNYNQLYVASVVDAVYPAESVAIAGESTVRATETIKLTATVSPAKASQSVVWSSSDDSKAIVSSDGTVTGVSEGPVTITATAEGSTVKADKAITVTAAPSAPVESVAIVNESFALDFPEESEPLVATVSPANAPSGVTWTSSNEDVAKIVVAQNGTVTVKSVAKGTAIITATTVGTASDESHKTATITVTVNRPMISDATISGYLKSIGTKAYDARENINDSEHLVAEQTNSRFYAKVLFKNGSYLVLDDGESTILCYSNYPAANMPSVGDVVLVNNPVNDFNYGRVVSARQDTNTLTFGESALTVVDNVEITPSTPAELSADAFTSNIYESVFTMAGTTNVPTTTLVKFSDVVIVSKNSNAAIFDYGSSHIQTQVTAANMEVGKHYDVTAYLYNTLVANTTNYITIVPLEASLTAGYVFAEVDSDAIDEGATTIVRATTVGKEESGDTYNFVSSDPTVAAFNGTHEGVATAEITGVHEGTVTITVTSTTTNKSGTVELTVEGAIKSKTVTFKSGDFGSNTKNAGTYSAGAGEPTWSFDAAPSNFGWDSNRGIQIGKSDAPINGSWTISAPVSSFGTFGVVGVSVNASMASSGDTKVAISIGSEAFLNATSVTTSAADYTASSLLTTPVTGGNIVITLSNTKKAAYIKSITVYYAAKALTN